MPQYLYKCPSCGMERIVKHGMKHDGLIQCASCFGVGMHKVPQPVTVNWNGNKPSKGGVTDLVQSMIADAPRQRDELAAKKELSDGS